MFCPSRLSGNTLGYFRCMKHEILQSDVEQFFNEEMSKLKTYASCSKSKKELKYNMMGLYETRNDGNVEYRGNDLRKAISFYNQI